MTDFSSKSSASVSVLSRARLYKIRDKWFDICWCQLSPFSCFQLDRPFAIRRASSRWARAESRSLISSAARPHFSLASHKLLPESRRTINSFYIGDQVFFYYAYHFVLPQERVYKSDALTIAPFLGQNKSLILIHYCTHPHTVLTALRVQLLYKNHYSAHMSIYDLTFTQMIF